MTHAVQVLHTLQWHHPGGPALAQLAQAPTQDYHSYTHSLLGGVNEEVTSPNGSPVRWQENTELLSVPGLKGTPQRVSLLGLGGKECSFGVHGADVDEVGLPALPQAEAELFVWWVQRPCLAGQKKNNRCCTNRCHARQATVKCGRERQEGDRVATGRRQGGDRKKTGKRQESGRKGTGSNRQVRGRRQQSCNRKTTGGRQGGDRETTGKRQETRHSDRISNRKAKGRRQEGNRASGDREATGKRQEKVTGERQESGRVFFCNRKATGRQQEGNRKARGKRQACRRRQGRQNSTWIFI